jgi:putative ABC transport system substrate-binding protein
MSARKLAAAAVGDPIFHRPVGRLPELALRARLPAVYLDSEVARSGGRPAEMPIEQPSKFLLVVNLRTAKALGVAVPSALLLRADEIIQ